MYIVSEERKKPSVREPSVRETSAGETPAGEIHVGEAFTRIAVVGIIVEQKEAVSAVNEILHQYGSYIIGRMGLPYREKQINIISVVIDAPADIISAMSGKLGRLKGVSSKALYSRLNRSLPE